MLKIVLMMMPLTVGRSMQDAIAVDYDNTISRNPEAFRRFLPSLARELNLKLIVATSRRGTRRDIEEFRRSGVSDWVDGVVWCGPRWKIDACRAAGFNPVIFLDDEPESAKRGGVWWAKISGAFKWIKEHHKRKD